MLWVVVCNTGKGGGGRGVYVDNYDDKSHEKKKEAGKKSEDELKSAKNLIVKNDIDSKKFFENLDECKWLSSKDVASLFSISENALRIMVYRNQIKVFKFGRRLRFKYSDCLALIREIGASHVD